jgi:replicative DNA helicase
VHDPYSIESEQSVLGAMMLRPELIDALSADLSAEDFYLSDHSELFRSILALHSEGKPIDVLTVSTRIGTFADGQEGSAVCVVC